MSSFVDAFVEVINKVPMGPPDPIIGTRVAFQKDKDPNKINLGVGAYRDADGNPYVFKIVRTVEEQILQKKINHVPLIWLRSISKLKEIPHFWLEPEISCLELLTMLLSTKELLAHRLSQELEPLVFAMNSLPNSCQKSFTFLLLPGPTMSAWPKSWG